MLHSPQSLCISCSAGIAAATTWNNGDKSSANLTVSNVGRTVTFTGGSEDFDGIRSVSANTTNQKVYIEHAIIAMTSTWRIGFAIGGVNMRLPFPWAVPNAGIVVYSAGGNIHDDSSPDSDTIGLGSSLAAGDRLGIAFDTGAMKLWVRKNGGLWNITPGGAQDPAAGTGGFSVVISGSPFYAYAWVDGFPSDAITTNFASSSWVDTAPAGYTQLAA